MLMVKALAGTGKTTTIVFGLGVKVPRGMVLSDEQKNIVKSMRAMKWDSCAAMAFNKSIADVLKTRLEGVRGAEAATSNAFGYRAWCAHVGKKVKVDGGKNRYIFRDLAGHIPFKERVDLENSVDKLVRLCKCNLLEPTPQNISMLCEEFDEEFNTKIADYVEKVFQAGLEKTDLMDYDDQLFLPIYHNISVPEFDMVVVDELQDLNKAKQELALRMAKVCIVGVGDEHQAIYGFSGADSDAMNNFGLQMKERDGEYGYTELPLTMTRRCPKRVVEVAKKYVPEFRAAPEAPEGEVNSVMESEFVHSLVTSERGRMVLCRTNAPLASLAFKLIGENRRCYIQGKEIGAGIKRDILSTKEDDLLQAKIKAIKKIEDKIALLMSRPFPNETKIESLNDRIACIEHISSGCDSVTGFCLRVDGLFKDAGQPGDIQLSTVHKAKGLEHENVCIYKPSKLPLNIKGKGKKVPKFQVQQEQNLAYVAYTRAMDTLTFVNELEPE